VQDKLGQPSSSFHLLDHPWSVEIWGPALFDFYHGQTGVATNCIEIHPVQKIDFVQEETNMPKATLPQHQKSDFQCGTK